MADFKKLRVYRHAHSLSLRVDKSARKIKDADYAYLRRQMIKTAQSMAANIVEGREKTSEAEFVRHLEIAKGSSSELEQHLITARDLELMTVSDFQPLVTRVETVRKMLNGLLDRLNESIREKKEREKKKKRQREAGSD